MSNAMRNILFSTQADSRLPSLREGVVWLLVGHARSNALCEGARVRKEMNKCEVTKVRECGEELERTYARRRRRERTPAAGGEAGGPDFGARFVESAAASKPAG